MRNQARQFDLALEKKWVTHDAYYRLYTTMVGMTVTDTWNILKKKESKHSSITEFADILARDMLDYAFSLNNLPELALTILSEQSSVAASTLTTEIINRNQSHTKSFLTAKKQMRCI